MPELFYRDFEASSPVETGTKHLLAAAARLAVSAELGVAQVPGQTGEQLRALFTPENLYTIGFIFAAWVIATIVGGPVAVAVDAILVGLGLLTLAERAIQTAGALKDWAVAAYEATTEADLKAAGGRFAEAVATIGVTTLELVVGHRVFRTARTKVQERFPMRQALRPQPRVEPKPRPPEPPRSPPPEPPRSPPPEPPARRAPGEPSRRLDRFGRRVREGAKGPGATKAAGMVPALAWGLGALVVVGGGVAVAAIALRPKGRKGDKP